MAVRFFLFTLLILSILTLFYNEEKVGKDAMLQDKPLLTFYDSTLYVVTPDNIESLVRSEKAMKYKDKTVLYVAKLISKSYTKAYKLDTIEADVIIQKMNQWTFLNDAIYTRDDFIFLKTDELKYYTKKRIVVNSKPFYGMYNGNKVNGKDMYIHLDKEILRALNVHFEIKI